MTFTEKLKKLVEARKFFNSLSDCIYEIAAGELDNSRFAIIYLNYEEDMLSQTLEITQHLNDKNIIRYFSAMILDLAEKGATYVVIDGQTRKITIDTFVNALILMEDYVENN